MSDNYERTEYMRQMRVTRRRRWKKKIIREMIMSDNYERTEYMRQMRVTRRRRWKKI